MKYGIIQHIKYLFNYNKTIVHLQIDLNLLPKDLPNQSYIFKEINPNDNDDLAKWIEVINDGYDDVNYTIDEAREHFRNHLFLDVFKTYLLLSNNESIATYGIGTYKINSKIGGSNRLVVKKSHQGKGIGKMIFLFGLNKLHENGIQYVEHVISITRKESLLLHFKCGFVPQYSRKYIQFKKQKRSIFIRLIVNYKLNRIYKKHLLSLSEKFLP